MEEVSYARLLLLENKIRTIIRMAQAQAKNSPAEVGFYSISDNTMSDYWFTKYPQGISEEYFFEGIFKSDDLHFDFEISLDGDISLFFERVGSDEYYPHFQLLENFENQLPDKITPEDLQELCNALVSFVTLANEEKFNAETITHHVKQLEDFLKPVN